MSPIVKNPGFRVHEPPFHSRIIDLIIDIEHLRRKEVHPTTHPYYYNQFRNIFHDLDAMGSARIDGNKTSISKYLEAKEDDPETKGRKTLEIDKVAEAMHFIDENLNETAIFQGFFTELHRMIREGITNQSSQYAGKFRRQEGRPEIPGNHAPSAHLIETYIEKLVTYISKKGSPKYDSIKAAYAHFEYLWIHPFREANGLTARILTYTMLLKTGFPGAHNRIINPTYAFCRDPEKYIELLRKADSGEEKDQFAWFEFALEGLRDDLDRMDQLTDYQVVKEKILIPAFKHPMFDRIFSDQDRLIIDIAIEKQIFQAADIRLIFPQKNAAEISKTIRWFREKEWITGLDENARKYVINFQNKYLIKYIISKLEKAGFIPFI
ncbi:MAG: Fic family protein [Bacteroidales bacterium]|nr:Fic family protein [Bacteroidales bacterium]